ncbi:TMEM216 [Cordylochernes scorpioides]|uniref:TMEM216 n=1 Tax=Cordylochernes scorpioides TaxID=51811 RepID=A0ABY6LKR5_9ARAC|nr:TMEM216 [Cordylochernes scorpioides]
MKKISQLKEDIHRSHLKISLAIVLVLKTDDLSSLPYQMSLYFGGCYSAFFSTFELLLLVFKYCALPYPVGYLFSEVVLLIFLAFLEYFRLFLGKKGNLTERRLAVGISLTLSVPALVGGLYFLLWQTYVLRVEILILALHLLFLSCQSLFGLFLLLQLSQ